MIKRHTSKTLFTHICDNLPPRYAEKIGAHTIFRTIGPKWQTLLITPELSEAIRPLTTQMGIFNEFELESMSLWKHAGKSFSTPSRHIGNSRIEFNQNGTTTFGEIIHILRVKSQTDPIFVIRPFSRLTPLDEMKSPYYSHPYLKARVMYHQPQPLLAITLEDLFGHSAVVENPPGTLGISLPTVKICSLFMLNSTFDTETAISL
ncbi:uncharacterized protein MELLADRAFT_69947 [Melampsora larici-populina 98AG31]|uniref:Uncharacterized protein n=1 Tax=Melampsora larici-populina (strain 98AG31 / pathotype 3-4-7) TaxID=747676 RepID=F4SCW6_MELLP|nr:uncharacterized protein MELLADRAFT_69947 [Melampsora larici-populina 98AG31]EGF97513.1 hypothetical protein MELLADRAFT_69947 [Melampsora larici-populina 98AG31]